MVDQSRALIPDSERPATPALGIRFARFKAQLEYLPPVQLIPKTHEAAVKQV